MAEPEDPLIPDPHDRFFKETFGRKEYAVPFLRRVIPPELSQEIKWETIERQKTTFLDQSLRKSSADLLFSVQWQGTDALLYCLFEHQSQSDPRMPLRLLRYMLRIWDHWEKEHPKIKALPLVIPIVLFQGKGRWAAPSSLREMIEVPPEAPDDWQAYVPHFAYAVVDVKNPSVRERFQHWQTRQLLSLLASILVEDDQLRLDAAFKALSKLATSQQDELTYLRTALTYLFAVSGEVDKQTFTNHIQKLENSRLKEAGMSIAEMLRAEGRQEGRQEGMQQGRQDAIVSNLSIRFATIPEEVEAHIRRISDPTYLEQLQRLSVTCATIEEFAKEIR